MSQELIRRLAESPVEGMNKNLKKRSFLKYMLGATTLAGGIGLLSKQKAKAEGVPYMWVHGTSVQVERPELTNTILWQGYFTYIEGKPNTSNWFHFSIPTLATTNNEQVQGGIVFFNTGSNNVAVTNMHLYVFSEKIAANDSLNVYGSNSVASITLPTPRSTAYGPVGISINVKFGAASPLYIEFVAAAGLFNNLY
ncbi:MAG: hypothetical protein JOZ78_21110 [Chroococcidiopsidaceae cyanobacterium CP_BM_ER_R8_30]|nr:hypothetical protein [Chroococcidiopsidaceae cyanobacterium CP_BM_ER_R8_30]